MVTLSIAINIAPFTIIPIVQRLTKLSIMIVNVTLFAVRAINDITRETAVVPGTKKKELF